MKPLSFYKKNRVDKADKIQTTVNIRQDQKDFLDSNFINLSEVARDAIDELMNQKIKAVKNEK